MCGIVGVVATSPVNQLLYDSLQLLQHRGQDAAGIATGSGSTFSMWKGSGMVREIFRTRNMRNLTGNVGIAHVRYPTAGSAFSVEEAQPFYVNAPFGITLGHNGNLTNAEQLKSEMFRIDRRHINTNSDSEILLNVLAHELQEGTSSYTLDPATIFRRSRRCTGACAAPTRASRISPTTASLRFATRTDPSAGLRRQRNRCRHRVSGRQRVGGARGAGLQVRARRRAGRSDLHRHRRQLLFAAVRRNPTLNPCIFEYVYFARPDSVMNGVSVYSSRLKMGEYLAEKIRKQIRTGDIDVVMPIPDTSRPAAMQLSARLGLEFREGFFKNRYVGRTFIMPGQAVRKRSVRQKLSALPTEFKGKNVLLVDDSIVRGTTSREIVNMAREAGANKVIFASAAPPVRYPNVYGIDMPTRSELIAHGRSDEEIQRLIEADGLGLPGHRRDEAVGVRARTRI